MKVWEIKKEKILPGESKRIRLSVARLPSNSPIYIHAFVHRAKKPGPCLLLLGGVHGDEVCGVEIVRRLLQLDALSSLQRGSIIAIPLVNVYGFIHFSREVPDGKDVNRSFPGKARGSLASRVAYAISRHILPLADYILDFHTAGAQRYNFPQVRYSPKSHEARYLSDVFGAPYGIEKPEISNTLRRYAERRGVPTLVYEGGEALRLDGLAIDKGVQGTLRVLRHLGMIDMPLPLPTPTVHLHKTTWIRASQSGIFTWTKNSGHRIQKDEPLGMIYDPYGTKEYVVTAPKGGHIIGHTNAPIVHQGDALFHIASERS